MVKKSLMETNPYLKDSSQSEKLILINVTTSTAVEIGDLPSSMVEKLKKEGPLLINPDFPK